MSRAAEMTTRLPAVGPYREQWITYRDAQTYERVVNGGPLYPLNSLMLHGLIYAQQHKFLHVDPEGDFRNEVRSYFGTGTQLQEMYITPSLLTERTGTIWRTRRVVAGKRGHSQRHALGRRRSCPAGGLWVGIMVTGKGHPRVAQSF